MPRMTNHRRDCAVCGESYMSHSGCTNRRCCKCHAKYCTPGGIFAAGHGLGNPPKKAVK